MGDSAASSSQDAVSRHRPCRARPDGRPPKNERPHPPAGGGNTQSIIMSPGPKSPVDLGKPGCLTAHHRPVTTQSPWTRKQRPELPDLATVPHTSYPRPGRHSDPLLAGRLKDAYGAATRALRAP